MKEFFSNISINGSYYQRAKTVVDFIRRESANYVCYSKDKSVGTAFSLSAIDGYHYFSNNDSEFLLARLKKQNKIEDFKKKVLSTIDSVESVGGSLASKRKRFVELFSGNVNVVLSDGDKFDVFFTYSFNSYVLEKRGKTKYEAWLTG